MIIQKFSKLPSISRKLVMVFYFYNLIYFIALLFIPFKKLIRNLAPVSLETEHHYSDKQLKKIALLQLIVRKSNKIVPLKFRCLVQSLSVSRILLNNRIPHVIILGIKKETGTIKAHSWLMCGKHVLTGHNFQGFAVVAKFKYG